MEQLTLAFLHAEARTDTRIIVLAARGKSFSAGADIGWMKQQGAASVEENTADATRLAMLFKTIAASARPTIARVQGACYGGALGLVSACDIALAASDAIFAASEVRLGLIPATISPYVVAAIGERQARKLFLTGERFSAEQACQFGLVHQVVTAESLDTHLGTTITDLLRGGPVAQASVKALMHLVGPQVISDALIAETAERIALCRAQPEAREGLSAFLEKRPAAWAVLAESAPLKDRSDV